MHLAHLTDVPSAPPGISLTVDHVGLFIFNSCRSTSKKKQSVLRRCEGCCVCGCRRRGGALLGSARRRTQETVALQGAESRSAPFLGLACWRQTRPLSNDNWLQCRLFFISDTLHFYPCGCFSYSAWMYTLTRATRLLSNIHMLCWELLNWLRIVMEGCFCQSLFCWIVNCNVVSKKGELGDDNHEVDLLFCGYDFLYTGKGEPYLQNVSVQLLLNTSSSSPRGRIKAPSGV